MRNPEYQFIPTDSNAVVSLLTSVYEKLTKTTVRPASPERLFIQWVSNVIIQERVLNNWTGNQNIPSRAEGENLDALAELYLEQTRPAAKAAVCTMRFHILEPQPSAILIPSGTRVTDRSGALVWATGTDVYINAVESFADTSVRCQTPGLAGNGYAAGQINAIVDVFAYCSAVRISPSPTAGRTRLRMKNSTSSCACPWTATAAPEAWADTVRPFTDCVRMGDPEVVPYDIDLTYYVQEQSTVSPGDLQTAVEEAVEKYYLREKS